MPKRLKFIGGLFASVAAVHLVFVLYLMSQHGTFLRKLQGLAGNLAEGGAAFLLAAGIWKKRKEVKWMAPLFLVVLFVMASIHPVIWFVQARLRGAHISDDVLTNCMIHVFSLIAGIVLWPPLLCWILYSKKSTEWFRAEIQPNSINP